MVAMEADDVKTLVTAVVSAADKIIEMGFGVRELTSGEKGVLVNILNRYSGGDSNRRTILGWLFGSGGEISTTKLSAGQWEALHEWIRPYKAPDGKWEPVDKFPLECGRVLVKARGGIPLDFLLADYDSGEDIF